MSLTNPALKCYKGYQKITGHVPGQGTISDHSMTLEKCGEECNAISECNSYEYNAHSGSCQLNKEDEPSDRTSLFEQFFCAKGCFSSNTYSFLFNTSHFVLRDMPNFFQKHDRITRHAIAIMHSKTRLEDRAQQPFLSVKMTIIIALK